MKFRNIPFSILDNSILDKLKTKEEIIIYTFLCRYESNQYMDLRDVAHKFGISDDDAMKALNSIQSLHNKN